jgi:hypothetical protein
MKFSNIDIGLINKIGSSPLLDVKEYGYSYLQQGISGINSDQLKNIQMDKN